MATESMQNIDIKDFTTISSVEGYDHVLISLFGGVSAKMTVSLFRSVVSRGLTPSIDENGIWHVGDEDTGVQAEAKTPEFRQGMLSVEWKYTYESDDAWRTFIEYSDTRPDYASMTEEQREAIRLKYSDLTPEEIAELQQPATEMIETLQVTDKIVREAETAREEAEDTRVESELARDKAEIARIEAEEERSGDYAILREEIVAATESANDAAGEIRNPPKIENGTWWIWDKEEDAYVDTENTAIGRSPKVLENHWWVWDDTAFEYVDTGIVVDNYKLTEEIAYGAREQADEAMKVATEAKNAVAKLEGLGDADTSSIIAAEVISQVESNTSAIQAMEDRHVVISEEEYDTLVESGMVDYSKYYFIYE